MIFLIDLDGTLLDTDHLHYEAWARVLKISTEYIEKVVTTHGIQYILDDFPDPSQLRRQKIREMLKFDDIQLMKNVESFIDFITENDINHVVVTNTDRKVVEHFRTKVPILNKLNNWIVREDYVNPKPDSECYRLALDRFGHKGDCVIGFENSKEGLEALSKITPNIFHIHPKIDYLKILEQVKLQCPKRFGMHPTNLNHMERRKLRPLKHAFVTAGLLVLVIALWNLKRGSPIYSGRDMDSL
jgi:beta-phosphoglucomutase